MDNVDLNTRNNGWKFLTIFFACVGTVLFLLIAAGTNHANAVIGIPLNGNWLWYRDFAGRSFPEIQDQDIFYQNVGGSIASVKKADIIILGPSFTTYAFAPAVLHQFSKTYNLKIYNMSFVGVCSGEFSRCIIKRWGIHPALWIINVDDYPYPFFSKSTDMWIGPVKQPIQTLHYGRLQGFLTVAVRNLRWRIEDWLARCRGQTQTPVGLYRNIKTGDMFLGLAPGYMASNNKKINVDRDQNCHTNAEAVRIARDFVKDIGGQAVFILVPESRYCPQQVRELSQALGVEAIITPNADYSSLDGGGHLDSKGATAYTKFVMSELTHTQAFRNISSNHSY